MTYLWLIFYWGLLDSISIHRWAATTWKNGRWLAYLRQRLAWVQAFSCSHEPAAALGCSWRKPSNTQEAGHKSIISCCLREMGVNHRELVIFKTWYTTALKQWIHFLNLTRFHMNLFVFLSKTKLYLLFYSPISIMYNLLGIIFMLYRIKSSWFFFKHELSVFLSKFYWLVFTNITDLTHFRHSNWNLAYFNLEYVFRLVIFEKHKNKKLKER